MAPAASRAQQPEAGADAVLDAGFANVATFDGVRRIVRDRFYDPHLPGLDWSAVRDRTMPDAARATSAEDLARVINSMLSELHASHMRFYTPDDLEYYQLADIFAGALRRRGLERAFPDGRIGMRVVDGAAGRQAIKFQADLNDDFGLSSWPGRPKRTPGHDRTRVRFSAAVQRGFGLFSGRYARPANAPPLTARTSPVT